MTAITENPPQLSQLGRDELIAAFLASELARRRQDVAHLELLREIESRGVKATWGYPSLASLVGVVAGSSRKEANRLAKLVSALDNLPVAAKALAAGEINAEHAVVIENFRRSLSAAVLPEQWTEAESTLVSLAKIWRPLRVARFARRELRLRLDPDAILPTEKELAQPRNEMSMTKQANGWYKFAGLIEPESGTRWTQQLAPGCRPRRAGEFEGPDTRTVAERRGDALEEWVNTRRTATPLANDDGEVPQLVVTIDWETLRSGLGHAELGPDNAPIPVSEARRLACDSSVLPIVLGGHSETLDVGQATRTVSVAVRRAVVHRDKHCAFPGCDRSSSACQVHHVIEWRHGGVGKPENLALLCGHHHRLVHHSEWEVRMTHGFPEFLPPAYLDPERKPRTNRAPDDPCAWAGLT